MKKFEGKVAVITGGSSGIGLATAKEFKEQGAKVVISGRDKKTLDEAVQTIGGDVLAVQSDVTNLSDIDTLFSKTKDKFGKIDALFVNAGIAKFAPVDATSESLFDETININLKGAYFTIQKALPFLNNNASIMLNTTAIVHSGWPGTSVYSASKAALLSLVKTLSAELIVKGIRVNAVSPGPISTPIFGKLGLPQEAVQSMAQSILEQVPMKRFGRPEEIAKAVLFLASSDSSYVLGAEIVADGGMVQF